MRDIERPVVMAHIRVGPAGVAGPVVLTSKPPEYEGVPDESCVNVHTVDTPSGAVRGQLH